MEAVLALLGAEAVTLVECIEQETSEGRPKPFQIESLLTDVVPSLLSISGKEIPTDPQCKSNHSPFRLSIPTRAGFCLCQQLRDLSSSFTGGPIPACSC